MAEFVIFRIPAEEEAFLTHVEIETFQAAITEADYRIFFADVAFGLCDKKKGDKF